MFLRPTANIYTFSITTLKTDFLNTPSLLTSLSNSVIRFSCASTRPSSESPAQFRRHSILHVLCEEGAEVVDVRLSMTSDVERLGWQLVARGADGGRGGGDEVWEGGEGSVTDLAAGSE